MTQTMAGTQLVYGDGWDDIKVGISIAQNISFLPYYTHKHI